VKLAEKGFYDGTMFHRVLAGFMIQGGLPEGRRHGGPGYTIKAEFNDVHHGRGVLSMRARRTRTRPAASSSCATAMRASSTAVHGLREARRG
jgi:cyclophilin family peptidyl-prolyl cis-trans isomerase